jgi:putative methyltransferase (TIGR04325 family)
MPRSDFLPPVLTRVVLRALGRSSLRGDYGSWQAALAASAAYQTDLTVYAQMAEEVRMRRRKSSRLLSPLLSAMLLAAGRARILDFGGNLGLVYFDVSNLADTCIDWWHVIDLPDIVALGNHKFAEPKLRFFRTIDESLVVGTPNIVICFHVLQYLESPFEFLSRLLSLAPEVFVLNEFPVAGRERFMVQHLMPELGGGSRPVRIFCQDDVAAAFADYELIEELGLPPWDRTLVGARHVARIYRRRPQELSARDRDVGGCDWKVNRART